MKQPLSRRTTPLRIPTNRGAQSFEILERFYRERQVLARLRHPNIVRILDGGTTPEALPYFVIDLVDGEPVDRYCGDPEAEVVLGHVLQHLTRFEEAEESSRRALEWVGAHPDSPPILLLVDMKHVFGESVWLYDEIAALDGYLRESVHRPGRRRNPSGCKASATGFRPIIDPLVRRLSSPEWSLE